MGGDVQVVSRRRRPTGAPDPMPNTTFTVYTDDDPVFTAALRPVDETVRPPSLAPIGRVALTNVQTLRLEVAVDSETRADTR